MSNSTQIAPAAAFKQTVERVSDQMARVLPRGLTVDRIQQIAIVEGSRNPRLYECDRMTVMRSLIELGKLGLEPDSTTGFAYLVPRYNRRESRLECSAMIGYKGLLELARRSGRVEYINAGVVYADELQPNAELGRPAFVARLEPFEVDHKWAPGIARDDKHIVGAYCVAVLSGGQKVGVLLDRADIERRRGKSESAGKSFSPWSSDYAAMARKSAIRALLTGGLVPLSPEDRDRLNDVSDEVRRQVVDLGPADESGTDFVPTTEAPRPALASPPPEEAEVVDVDPEPVERDGPPEPPAVQRDAEPVQRDAVDEDMP